MQVLQSGGASGRHRPIRRFLLVYSAVLAGLVSTQAFAQSVTEAKFVLRDIQRQLPGAYDNDPQVFVESAFGAGDDGNHNGFHLSIEALPDTGLGEAVFVMNTSVRANPETPEVWSLLAFSLDEPMRAVRMASYALPAAVAESGDAAAIASAASAVAPECPVYWRQGPGHVYGGMRNAWCDTNLAGAARQMRLDWRLTPGEMTVYRAVREPSGRWVEGRVDEVPLRFTKVKWYQCFINIEHADGVGQTTINPFTMHDGGDVYTFRTEETPPRTIEVLLRRSMWTSRSGNNFVPLLHMWVYADGNRDAPLASSWADTSSGRVGWDAQHIGGGRCKVPTAPPFD